MNGKKVIQGKTLTEIKELGLDHLAALLESSVGEDSEEVADESKTVVEESKDDSKVATLFEGIEGLPEGFVEKATVLFEAAVIEKADKISAEKLAQVQEAVDSTLEEQANQDAEQLDAYLSYVTEEWMKENKPILESKVKVEMADTLIEAIADVFSKYKIEVNEATDTTIEDLQTKLDESNSEIDRLVLEVQSLKTTIDKMQCESVIESATAGMTDLDAEKFKKVLGEMEFEGVEDLQTKVSVLKEAMAKEVKESVDSPLTESIEVPVEGVEEKTIDPRMQKYIDAIRSTSRPNK